MVFSQKLNTHIIFKRLAKALIRLRVSAGWSEPLLVAHTTLLKISCRGSFVCLPKGCLKVVWKWLGIYCWTSGPPGVCHSLCWSPDTILDLWNLIMEHTSKGACDFCICLRRFRHYTYLPRCQGFLSHCWATKFLANLDIVACIITV